jgi:hypothetical protein
MSGAKAAKKKKLSFWQTLRAAPGSYRRLYGYVKPYEHDFPRRRSQCGSHTLKSSRPRYRPKDQFDRPHLSRHPGDYDCAQPLFLREHLLHAMGE